MSQSGINFANQQAFHDDPFLVPKPGVGVESDDQTKEDARGAAQIMISEARNSGKCADLYDLSISGPHQDQQSNWHYMIIRSGGARISSECDAKLRVIAGRMQAKYDLSGD